VQEVQGGDAELAEGSVGREKERKRELRGSQGGGGANGGGGSSGRRGGLGSMRGTGRGVEGEGEGPFAKQGRGEEPG